MAEPLRLLILTQYFPPETGAPQARLSEMALHLQGKGVLIEVLTAMPNYPAGKIFDGYKGKWFVREDWKGLSLIRSFIYPTKNPGLVPRLLNYFSFVFSSLISGLFMARKADIIFVESPPLFLGITGYLLSLFKGARLVFNVSDLWPETAVALGLYGRDSKLVRTATVLEKFLYRKSDSCTGQSFGIVRGIREKNPLAKIALIPNGADCGFFTPERKNRALLSQWTSPEKTVVGYAGLIGIAQGIGLILETAKHLEKEQDIVFLIAGDGPEREALQAKAGSNVIFTGLAQKSDMPALIASFDMTIIPLKKHIPGALPSKMYEAMASAVPIILAAEGDPKELLEKSKAGLYAGYDDIEAVAGAVLELRNNPETAKKMGANGRAYVQQYHQRQQIADKLLATLRATADNDNAFFESERQATERP